MPSGDERMYRPYSDLYKDDCITFPFGYLPDNQDITITEIEYLKARINRLEEFMVDVIIRDITIRQEVEEK